MIFHTLKAAQEAQWQCMLQGVKTSLGRTSGVWHLHKHQGAAG